MDLPFAVDSSPDRRSTSLHHSNASSLVTASSQGSLLPDNSSPEHSSYSSQEQSPYSNTIIAADADMNDFTYVNVCETDEVDVIMDGQVPSPEDDTTRGDILAVLLSGGTQDHAAGESIVVSYSNPGTGLKPGVEPCYAPSTLYLKHSFLKIPFPNVIRLTVK